MNKHNAAILVVLLISAVQVRADTKDLFDVCVSKSGVAYAAARDAFLAADGIDRNVLARMAKSDDVREQATAIALSGWLDNGVKYKRLVNDRIVKDRLGQERFDWVSDPTEVSESLMPLMYEFLLKDSSGSAGRHAAIRIVPYLARKGKIDSMSILSKTILDPRTARPSRLAIAVTASRLPDKIMPVDDLLGVLTQELERKDRHKEVVLSLLDGMIRRSPVLSEDAKASVIRQLRSSESLSKVLAPATVTHAIGSIGGESAVPVVREFLHRAEGEQARVWAIGTLGSIGSDAAVDAILDYTRDTKISQGLNLVVISSLGDSQYSDKVGAALRAVLHDREAAVDLRIESLQAIEKLFRANATNKNTQDSIKGLIRDLDRTTIDNAALIRKFDSVIQGFDG